MFRYVWIGILIAIDVVWFLKCWFEILVDLINGNFDIFDITDYDISAWFVINLIVLFAGSFITWMMRAIE